VEPSIPDTTREATVPLSDAERDRLAALERQLLGDPELVRLAAALDPGRRRRGRWRFRLGARPPARRWVSSPWGGLVVLVVGLVVVGVGVVVSFPVAVGGAVLAAIGLGWLVRALERRVAAHPGRPAPGPSALLALWIVGPVFLLIGLAGSLPMAVLGLTAVTVALLFTPWHTAP
jgi:hypothetical protein